MHGPTPHIRPGALALEDLWNLFPADGLGPAPRWRVVLPEELPAVHRRLLVHHRHMTLALAERHGAPVELRVLASRRERWTYCRRSFLSVEGTGAPALLGMVRIHLGAIPPDTRDKVLEEKTPLGAVLIGADILRRIEPLAYIEVDPTPELAALLGATPRATLYGRLAAIHCAGEPAIDLLEIAAP